MTLIDYKLTIQLTGQAHTDARKFASQQATRTKGKQVYLNTLAVYAVQDFLKDLKIPTDLTAGESWNSVIRRFNNVADLVIPDLGKLECLPVLPGETTINLPPEVSEDRIAYVAVQFQEELTEVQLLGFYPTIDPQVSVDTIDIANLEPIETLIDYLDRLESGKELLEGDSDVAQRVRERLADLPIGEIVAQMERIYRTCNPNEWRYAGGEFLLSRIAPTKDFAFRGDKSRASVGDLGDEETELQDVAEDLLDKFDEIWSEAAGTTPKKLAAAVTPVTPIIVPQPATPAANGLISLGEWLQNPEQISAEHWLPLASYLNDKPANLLFRFANAPRSGSAEPEQPTTIVSKVSEISLGGHPLVLLINCEVKSDDQIDILVRLYPKAEEQPCLPPELQLVVIDNKGEVFLEAESRSADNWIQLQFWGEPAEQFSIKLVLGDDSITQEFVI